MNALAKRLLPYRPLLLSPLIERRAQGSLWLVWVLLALTVIPGPLVAAVTGRWNFGLIFGTIPLLSLLLMVWVLFLKNAVRQNTPANACLVPQLRRRLIRITAASGMVGALLAALPIGLLTGEPLLALAGTGGVVLMTLLAQRYVWIGFVPAVISFGASRLGPQVSLAWLTSGWVGQHHHFAGALLVAAEAVLSGFALRGVYPQGGELHWRRSIRLNLQFDMQRNGGHRPQGDAVERWYNTGIGKLMGRYAWLGFGAMLARDTVRAPGAGPRRMRMMLYVLGPRAHWSTAVVQVFCMLALSAGMVWLIRARSDGATSFIGPTFTAAFGIIAQMGFVHAFVSAIKDTPVEQGLVLLAPGAPARAAVNGLLARAALRRFSGLWLLSSCGALVAGMLLGGRAGDVGYALSLSALSLPLAALLPGDYARCDTLAGRALLTVTLVTALAALLLFAMVRNFLVPLPWPMLGMGSAAVTALLLRRRWRAMLAMACAFPAGRIA